MKYPKALKRFLARHRISRESFARDVYFPLKWRLGQRGDLPTLLIVGAQKAGTTTLHRLLAMHPKIKEGLFKESHFFDKSDQYRRGENYYRAIFPKRAADEHILDSSPMMYHEAIPERAAEVLPDARIIMILREPVARTFSHYRHNFARQRETLSFEEALAAEEDRIRHSPEDLLTENERALQYRAFSYKERSRYDTQLERWWAAYGRDRVKVLIFEEFIQDPQAAVDEVLEWLDLAPMTLPASAYRARNESVISGKVSPQTKTALQQEMAPSVARLSGLLQRDLPWNYPSAADLPSQGR
ncbi:sulfotransferase family protein [Salipiger thiooxidans]|uniref:sulfotransferase family protein n=1 Tax=Salipiger thiooxidans TaxID=282683 RepID=UPI001CFBFF4B|nr:sulfotransferase [Salipiger thiooxidans]